MSQKFDYTTTDCSISLDYSRIQFKLNQKYLTHDQQAQQKHKEPNLEMPRHIWGYKLQKGTCKKLLSNEHMLQCTNMIFVEPLIRQ